MITCLTDGVLQAYLDRELTVREMGAADIHLAECQACTKELERCKKRAVSVDALLGTLGEELVENGSKVPATIGFKTRKYIPAAALAATAAVILLAFLLLPRKNVEQPTKPTETKHVDQGPELAETRMPGSNAHTVSANTVGTTKPQAIGKAAKSNQKNEDDFIALTPDEPFQIGTVVKMSFPASMFSPEDAIPTNDRIMAEVIVGEDGRPRAIRFLH